MDPGGDDEDMFESPASSGAPRCIVGHRYKTLYGTPCQGDLRSISEITPVGLSSLRFHLNGVVLEKTEFLCNSHLPENLEKANVKRFRGCCGLLIKHDSFRKKRKYLNLEMCVNIERDKGFLLKPGFSLCLACYDSTKTTADVKPETAGTENAGSSGIQQSFKCFAREGDSKVFGEICGSVFFPVKEMSWEKMEMLKYLLDREITPDAELCDKHLPSKLQSIISWKHDSDFCANPFNFHEKRNVTRVRVDLSICRKVQSEKLRLGQGLCSRCHDHTKTMVEPERPSVLDPSADTSEGDESGKESSQKIPASLTPPEFALVDLNMICTRFGIKPLDVKDHRSKPKLRLAKQKYEELKSYLKAKFKKALKLEEDALSDEEVEKTMNDHEKLFEDVREKILATKSFRHQVQLLTIVPLSWTVQEMSDFFSVTKHAVRVAKRLRRESGILSMPGPRKVRSLDPETLKLIDDFYNCDEFARECPGAHVSLGKKNYVQKKLMLCSIDELYATFKERHPALKIARSKFYELRPKWCVFPGSSGTHTICVCKYHENFHLCATAANFNEEEKKSLLKEAMCKETTRECYLRVCENCPSVDTVREKVRDRIKKKFETVEDDLFSEDEDIDSESESEESIRDLKIQYKQWVKTDRPDLVFVESSFEDFCEEVTKQILTLLQHEFVTVQQAKYVKNVKASLSEFKILAYLDFSENYSYTIQNETQSHYFNKGSLTIHPAVLYFRENGEIKHKSLCYISEDTTHDVAFVQVLLKHLTDYVKTNFPYVTEIEYISDGCGGQYKNCKNFLLLCQHEKNFDLKASWTFFATSHGKSACDAIGGRVKLDVKTESLRRVKAKDKPINSINEFSEFRKKKESEGSLITHFILNKEEIQAKRAEIESLNPAQVQGTRSFHHYQPITETIIGCKRVSTDEDFSLKFDLKQEEHESLHRIELNSYVACVIDKSWVPAFVTSVDEQGKEIDAVILTPITGKKQRTFEWPKVSSSFTFPYAHVLTNIDITIKTSSILVNKMREVNKKLTLFLKKS